jgi:hypothetical protein
VRRHLTLRVLALLVPISLLLIVTLGHHPVPDVGDTRFAVLSGPPCYVPWPYCGSAWDGTLVNSSLRPTFGRFPYMVDHSGSDWQTCCESLCPRVAVLTDQRHSGPSGWLIRRPL